MMCQCYKIYFLITCVLMIASSAYSETVLVQFQDGEVRAAEIFLEEGQIFIHPEECREEFLIEKKSHAGYRDYHKAVSTSEKKEIRFILKTLAQKSLTSLWGYKKKLQSSGDKIDHIHPLKFLECIFSDNELKVYAHNIRKRGSWVWSEFIKGNKKTLNEEQDLGNLTEEHIHSFANILKIDVSLIDHHIYAARWEDFIKSLIDNIPREGNPDRYDQ